MADAMNDEPGLKREKFPTCLILAGGLGTRLRPVLDRVPKCLAPIAGRPFLAHQLEWLARGGVRRAVVCTGYLADQVRVRFGSNYAGIDLSYSEEKEPLGTGGAVRLAMAHSDGEEFLVVNGDSFTIIDYESIVSLFFAVARLPLVALAEVADTARFGRVEWKPRGCPPSACQVEHFFEKGHAGHGWINAGIYLLPREILEGFPVGEAFSLERGVFPRLVASRLLLAAPTGRMFIDIGTPESYAAAETFFEEAAQAIPATACPPGWMLT